MISVARFASRTPSEILINFLAECEIAVPTGFNWSAKLTELGRRVEAFVDASDNSSRFLGNLERIAAMADEPGQVALYSVMTNHRPLDNLQNGHARACWAFLNDRATFRRAEEVRFTDEHRRGRIWSGVLTEPGLQLQTSKDVIETFKKAVIAELKSANVHVDVFDRQRAAFDDEKFQIAQVTVYRDGRPEDVPDFLDGKFTWRSRRPVYEAALTYESATGIVEAVAQNTEIRKNLLRIFVRTLLGSATEEHELPLREYNLDRLLRVFDFPTDPEDGIESVRVAMLRLKPVHSQGERITLECSRSSPHTIWTMASENFGFSNPLLSGWTVTQAKLVIRFRPAKGSGRGKTLPVTITMPAGCDLKERTSSERLIGEKYLRRWNILADV
jgi:hypothetical protein